MIYLIITGLVSSLILMSVGMYVFNNDEVSSTFEKPSCPGCAVYPLALAKASGLIAI